MAKSFRQTRACFTIETTATIDSTNDHSRYVVDGTIYAKDGTTFCSYKEATENGEVNTIVKIDADAVTIIRNGEVSMRQQFIIARETNGMYKTPFGSLAMRTLTKDLRFKWDVMKAVGTLFVAYDLWMQGNYTGFYTVKIHMEGVQS